MDERDTAPREPLRNEECSVTRSIAGERSTRGSEARGDGADRVIAELAQKQHGVVARAQLTERGVKLEAIEGRIGRGQLHAVHRGIYAVGHRALALEGRLLAAVLACGSGTVLSHRSAARIWRILPGSRGPIELTRARGWRAPTGVWVHRAPIPPDEVTAIEGVPVTCLSRTLLDLAVVVTRRRLEQAINEVQVLGLSDALSLRDLLDRYPRRRGSRVIRDLLRDEAGSFGITRSDLEDRFVALLEAHGLPRPRLNARVRVRDRFLEVDCVWPDRKLVVELDGRGAHGTALAFERDRERDRLLIIAGWRVIRLTWRQIHEDAEAVVADLRRAFDLADAPQQPEAA
jgi:very-short-patch-repair endonuclease